MQRNLLHPGNAWDWWEHCVGLCDDEQGWREQELLQSEGGTVGGVVRCDSGELLCQRSLWLHGFVPEGLEMVPGHTLGHPLTSAAPNFCSVEVHLEEKMSGAQLCHAVLMATA